MNTYDPNIPMLRELLALQILEVLDTAGFTERQRSATAPAGEKIYERTEGLPPGMKILVYTTVVGGEMGFPYIARESGKDAIRVAAVYLTKDGKTRGLSKETRTNRTGNIEDIADRMLQRMRSAWTTCTEAERCQCGAPKFITKKGNRACAELCWLTEEEKNKPYIKPRKVKKYRRRAYKR